MPAFDLALGLWVLGLAMFEEDAQSLQLGFDRGCLGAMFRALVARL